MLSTLLRKKAKSVHPHASGEYTRGIGTVGAAYGSSPREWGVFFGGNLIVAQYRFIPTRVGSINAGLFLFHPCPVHPHASGEYLPCVQGFIPRHGSSPREWGVSDTSKGSYHHCRFIPTRVGSISKKGFAFRSGPVHPHASGEYLIAGAAAGRASVHPHASGEYGNGGRDGPF